MLQTPLRLDDALARDVRMQWFEGVAIVQAVCRQLVAAGRAGGFPLPAAILISADGTVAMPGAPPIGDAVPNAARLLSAMLADDFPVQLRLILSQAADGAYATLEELSSALAYYERPDGEQILRAFHARASQAPRRTGGELPAEEPAFVQEAPRASGAAAAGRRERWPVAAAILVVAFIGGAIWVLEFGSGSTRIDAAIESFKGTLSRTLGVVSADSVVEPVADPVPVEASAATRKAPPVPARPQADVKTPDERVAPAASPQASPTPTVAAAVPEADPPALGTSGGSDPRFYSSMHIVAGTIPEVVPAVDGGRIYSRQDPGIVPPRPVYPQLPAAPPAGTALDGRTIVDLVITPTGQVEGARLRTAPRNVHEFMLLSAAKAWRFDPAVHEDGHAVRFRHSVVITAYP